tara:strand:+ start:81059 stop:81940 length:882 start_codon:yes stop_codon:yes gene_type:complete
MSVGKRDRHTGQMTTGHEWGGIEELNTPVPRTVYFFLAVTFVFSLVYWILLPAWPLGLTFTRGVLGVTQHSVIDADIQNANAAKSVWTDDVANKSFSEIQADPELMRLTREAAGTLFGDNCAACHGSTAEGGPGFPSLVDHASLWGRSPEAIMETLRVGINSTHEDTRMGEMLAFGRDGILTRDEIRHVAAYVSSLSDPSLAAGSESAAVSAGREVFSNNCVACHGENGKGNTELGAPDLTDKSWVYGGDRQSIFTTVYGGRKGHMPTWEARLGDVERKMLTLYILDKEAGKP